jgi:pilus assembly protein CpaC
MLRDRALSLLCLVRAFSHGLGVLAIATAATPILAQQADVLGGANSILRLSSEASLPVTRRITLGLHKAMIVELPVDGQDVIVSHTETIDATVHTPRRITLYAKSVGDANVFFLGRDARKLLILDIKVKRDLTDLGDMLKRLLPGSRLKLSASGEGVVLSGGVAHGADASRAEEIAKQYLKNGTVVNLISVAEKEQVLLKITVAELQRDAIRRLGINLPQAIASTGPFTFSKIIQNGLPASSAVSPAAQFIGAGQVPALSVGSALQATARWNGNTASSIIESFERVGLSRTLAEPTLTAISGETAKFLAGGEFPIPIASQNNSVSVTWKSFGVNIAFTPFVLAEGRISLKVAAEVSELSSQGAVTLDNISIPALQVRRAETTVEMPSGSALAIAGLLSDQTRQNVDGVPGLRNVPVLGALFRSKDFRKGESELVIMVTPYVVRPTDRNELSRPDEGFAPAGDLKGVFLGHLNRLYSPTIRSAGRSLKDDYGFIIEYPEYGDIE